MAVKTYDPKAVAIIVGATLLSGFADGDFMTVAYDEPHWSTITGADGETTRSKNANLAGTFTLRLLASSAANDQLSALCGADLLSGSAPFPMLVKDNRGTSVHSAATAWVEKFPDAAYGKEAGIREWVIKTDELINFVGGTNP